MTIHLTPQRERRVRAVISRGAYESVEEVLEAALAAVEQRTLAGFARTQEETGLPACGRSDIEGTYGRRILEFGERANGRDAL